MALDSLPTLKFTKRPENKADVAGKICDESGQLIDDEGVRNQW